VGKKIRWREKSKTTLFVIVSHFVLCVCFWIVTDFTKYFYADFSGCDRRQTLLCDSASGCIARHVKLKTTFDVWYGEKLKGGLRSYCKVKSIIIQDIF
jgi:hypothetical protein